MADFEIKDNLNLEERSDIDDLIQDDEENYLWSGVITKINSKEKEQDRDFIITNKNIINAGNKGNFIKNIFKDKVRRVIPIS